MSGLTIIGPRALLIDGFRTLVAQLEEGAAVAESSFTNNGPGLPISLSIEVDESEPDLGVTAELQ